NSTISSTDSMRSVGSMLGPLRLFQTAVLTRSRLPLRRCHRPGASNRRGVERLALPSRRGLLACSHDGACTVKPTLVASGLSRTAPLDGPLHLIHQGSAGRSGVEGPVHADLISPVTRGSVIISPLLPLLNCCG